MRSRDDRWLYCQWKLAVTCLLLAATGCSDRRGFADLRWVEPVTLASGETIRVARHVEMIQTTAVGGGFVTTPVYKTSSISLIGSEGKFPLWNAPMVPIVLDKDSITNEWIIIAAADGCSIWARNGRPRPPYWAFRLRNGEWYRDSIPSAFLGRSANLFVEFRISDDSDELDQLIETRKLQQVDNPNHPTQYRRIDPNYKKRCDQAPTEKIGQNELDLKHFRSVP